MDFFNVLERRHSIRNFTSKPVEREKLDRIVAAANAAPSAANLQAYEIFVVTQVRHRVALAKAACAQGVVLTAPVSLVFCANPARNDERFGERGRALFSIQDATIACAYAQLAATAQDMGSVWVGSFEPDAVRDVVGASEELEPVSILTLGYTEGEPEIKERRPLDDLVHTI